VRRDRGFGAAIDPRVAAVVGERCCLFVNGFCTAIGERDDIPAVRSPTNQEIWTMATKQGKNDNRLSDKEAMHIAETTDVSPGQAKELAEKHGKDKAEKEAKNFKAEG
jgi:hypothetical protein